MKTLRERANITQEHLAEIAGMTPLAIHRYEQYLYAQPSLQYIAALSSETGMPTKELTQMYKEGRASKIAASQARLRAINLNRIAERVIERRIPGKTLHPFDLFYRTVLIKLDYEPPSEMAWCVLTCFHPGQMHRFMTVGKSIPAVQREFLRGAGLSGRNITGLNSAIRNFHDR